MSRAYTMDEPKDGAVETVVIPILEEVARVQVRPVDRGGVAVHIHVSERDERVALDLLQDEVSVERVVVDRVVETAPTMRQDGDVLIIPVLEERVVTVKQLVLKEELHVRRRQATVPWSEVITLRTEAATVEPIGRPDA